MRAALVLSACWAFVGVGCAGGDPPARHLLLISLDTLRPDHLGCYGHDRPTSPTLDALAADGVVFERALATAPWTLPSHGSLFTGLYPAHHGARTISEALNGEVETLAGVLARAGFETGGFFNTIFLGAGYGLDRGFQLHAFTKEDHSRQGAAGQITQKAIRWLEGRPAGKRTFLFLHYFDLHSDYRSEPRYEQMFADGSARRIDGSTKQLRQINQGVRQIDADDAEDLKRLYDAGIRQLDDELAELFRRLEERGWLQEALVIITSDHGEEFLEHGGVLHTRTHYDELLRVPLILRGPRVPPGVRVATPVSLIDVAPTALALLGLDEALGEGIDLSQLWRPEGRRGAGRLLFAEGGPDLGAEDIGSVQDGRYKWIVDAQSGRGALFDLQSDPAELQDLAEQRREVASELAASLEGFLETRRPGAPGPDFSEDLRQRLRGLGYVD